MVRAPCIDKNGLKKGAWSEEEDNKLRAYVQRYGHWNWRQLPKFAGLNRCGKSCRLRWMNYLKPGVRRGNYTHEEEELILKLHQQFGNKWSVIASKLPGRTDNEIKNHWHTYLRRKMKREYSRSTSNTSDEETLGRSHHRMDSSDDHHNQQSSSLSTFDSVQKNDQMETTNYNIAATDHVDCEVSSLSYDPTLFHGELDWSTIGDSLCNPVETIMEPFGDTFWSQPFSVDTSYNINSTTLHQQLPPLMEDETMCSFSSYLDDDDIIWLRDLLR